MRRLPRAFLASAVMLASLAGSSPALAQTPAQPSVSAAEAAATTVVRTARERVLVWARNPSRVVATLPQGVSLDALSRDAQWVEVRLPEKFGGPGGQTGYVFEGHVTLESGPPLSALPMRSPAGVTSERAPAGPAARPRPPAFGGRAYGEAAYQWFSAKDSFNAIFESSSGPFYGGGGQLHIRQFYVDVSVSRFEKTGERVFVFEDEIFRLGIPNRVTITPLVVTAGYRVPMANRTVPYLGGGIGSVKFEETSDEADADENVDERFTSYHAVGGVEYGATRWLFVAGEVRYAWVPDALGAPGVSAEFDESDLGGVSVAVKVMIGR